MYYFKNALYSSFPCTNFVKTKMSVIIGITRYFLLVVEDRTMFFYYYNELCKKYNHITFNNRDNGFGLQNNI